MRKAVGVFLPIAIALGLSGCGPSAIPTVSSRLPDGTNISLSAGFEPQVGSIVATVTADKSAAHATITIKGPTSWQCDGPLFGPGASTAPYLDAQTLQLSGRPGQYTIVLSIAGVGDVLSSQPFQASGSSYIETDSRCRIINSAAHTESSMPSPG